MSDVWCKILGHTATFNFPVEITRNFSWTKKFGFLLFLVILTTMFVKTVGAVLTVRFLTEFTKATMLIVHYDVSTEPISFQWDSGPPKKQTHNRYLVSCSVFCVLFSVFCLLSSVFCFLFSVFCLLSSVICILSSAFCIVYSVLCIVSSVFCILSSAFCLLSSAFCLQSSVFCMPY